MIEIIGWILLGAGPSFLLGLFVGERWQRWSDMDDPVQMDGEDDYLQAIYKQIGGEPEFHKRQAD